MNNLGEHQMIELTRLFRIKGGFLGQAYRGLIQAFSNQKGFLRSGLSYLRLCLSWSDCWVSFALNFQCLHFCESSCLFYLRFHFDFYVSKIMHL